MFHSFTPHSPAVWGFLSATPLPAKVTAGFSVFLSATSGGEVADGIWEKPWVSAAGSGVADGGWGDEIPSKGIFEGFFMVTFRY